MPADIWVSIATQIPVVLLFCIFMGYIVKLFLDHINAQEERSRLYIKEQRDTNNATAEKVADAHTVAIKELTEEHRETMERLTDGLKIDMATLASCITSLNSQNIGHDVFVRTAFKERFGASAMTAAEQAATAAEAQAQSSRSKI